MTTTTPNQLVTPLQKHPRPLQGLGAMLIGREEEELVLDVIRRQELFRYYGCDRSQSPPPMAARLEQEFRECMGVQFALAVTSGTAALEVALGALGVGPGDEVIVPAWSWVSCFTSIVRVGALPVLAEIDETFSLAPGEITRLRTPRTKAVIVVHFQGVAADLEPILTEAKQAGIKVLEDCAESAGVVYHGNRVGTLGDIGIYSFQYHKTMTSGEGGMVVTNEARLYERAVRMHDIGLFRPYHEQFIAPVATAFCGSQFRMAELTAAVALAQLRKLDRIRAHCRRLQARVMARMGSLPGLEFRRIPDPGGDTGFAIYFSPGDAATAAKFREQLDMWNVNCNATTGTYCHYAGEYCRNRGTHAPGASPFARFEQWPAPGYRAQDFPQTEALVHRFITVSLGMLYTDEDADYIGRAVEQVHTELRR